MLTNIINTVITTERGSNQLEKKHTRKSMNMLTAQDPLFRIVRQS